MKTDYQALRQNTGVYTDSTIKRENRTKSSISALAGGLMSVMMGAAMTTSALGAEVETTLQVVTANVSSKAKIVYLQAKNMEGKKPNDLMKLNISSNRIPTAIKYKGEQKITMLTHTDGEGFQELASVDLLDDCKRTIVVISPEIKADEPEAVDIAGESGEEAIDRIDENEKVPDEAGDATKDPKEMESKANQDDPKSKPSTETGQNEEEVETTEADDLEVADAADEVEEMVTYQAKAIDATLNNFKRGTRKIVNLSKTAIKGELGAQPFTEGDENNITFECQSGEIADVPVLDPKAKSLASQPVILHYQQGENEWRTLSSTRWFHTPTQRHLIIVVNDAKRKGTFLHGFSETVRK